MPADAMPCADPVETEALRIARGLRRQDRDVIHELVGRHQYRLLRYLISMTGRRDGVEDLVQETWIRVLERARQYDGRSRFEPWLFTIARHLAIDHMRKRANASFDTRVVELPDASSPFAAAARSQEAARLASAVQQLEPIYREALLLRFQEELSLEEIARVTGAPVPTVSSRIRRGLAALRAQWKGDANAV
jgi:RNA polymerase sigma-70 factor (ECF subfamily)